MKFLLFTCLPEVGTSYLWCQKITHSKNKILQSLIRMERMLVRTSILSNIGNLFQFEFRTAHFFLFQTMSKHFHTHLRPYYLILECQNLSGQILLYFVKLTLYVEDSHIFVSQESLRDSKVFNYTCFLWTNTLNYRSMPAKPKPLSKNITRDIWCFIYQRKLVSVPAERYLNKRSVGVEKLEGMEI